MGLCSWETFIDDYYYEQVPCHFVPCEMRGRGKCTGPCKWDGEFELCSSTLGDLNRALKADKKPEEVAMIVEMDTADETSTNGATAEAGSAGPDTRGQEFYLLSKASKKE